MPIYQYKCSTCGNEFDKIVSHYDTDKKEECPECGSPSDWNIPTGSRDKVKFFFNYMAPDCE